MLDIHPRRKIREAAKKALKESEYLSPAVKSKTYHNRAFSFRPEDMPAIKIMGVSEDSELISETTGRTERTLDLAIEIMTSSSDESAQDQADDIALGIEKTLRSPQTIGVKSCEYKRCRIKDHDGKGQILSTILMYEIVYELSGDDLGWFEDPDGEFKETHMNIER